MNTTAAIVLHHDRLSIVGGRGGARRTARMVARLQRLAWGGQILSDMAIAQAPYISSWDR